MKSTLLILCLLFNLTLLAQVEIVENGPLYTSEEIPKVHITINQDSLETLYLEENWYENHEYPALFVFESQSGFDTVANIGLRFRGNTARDKVKKSFKVSFNSFISGQKFHGVEKMNLNAEVNDPSMIRSRLYWDLCKDLGIVSSRSNHVEVYINEWYAGLYQNIEHIDEEFVETWFGNNIGNLYKVSYPGDLNYISDNPDDYKIAPWGSRTYELKTNTALDDYSDLAEFIAFLNQASSEDLECHLDDYFNVSQYLKIAALDVLTGNWDGYIYNMNNYYLYHNPINGQFEYIPYDADNTFGIDWLNVGWADRDLYEWSHPDQPRPLFNRLLEVDAFRDIYSWHVMSILENHLMSDQYSAAVTNLQDFISESALEDIFRTYDFGATDDDFENSLNQGFSWFITHGVLDFIDERGESALSQIDQAPIAPIITKVTPHYADLPNSFSLTSYKEGPICMSASLIYSIDNSEEEVISIEGNQDTYEFTLDLSEGATSINFNIVFSGEGGFTRMAYCENRELLITTSGIELVINEVMTSNQSTIFDENNDADDWIEIYNPGEVDVELGEYYLSDNNSSSIKWNFPDIVIESQEFLIVWADKEIEEGSLHANFRLSQSGENLYLFKDIENGTALIDQISIPSLPSDYSFGRETDASVPWVLFENTTPGASNSGGSLGIVRGSLKQNLPFPNPTSNFVFLHNISKFQLFDISGRVVLQGNGSKINLGSLNSGIYILNTALGTFRIQKL